MSLLQNHSFKTFRFADGLFGSVSDRLQWSAGLGAIVYGSNLSHTSRARERLAGDCFDRRNDKLAVFFHGSGNCRISFSTAGMRMRRWKFVDAVCPWSIFQPRVQARIEHSSSLSAELLWDRSCIIMSSMPCRRYRLVQMRKDENCRRRGKRLAC
jgi:hypothetical protein